MTRQDRYDAIISRMHSPENYEKYDAINIPSNLSKKEHLIAMHLSHIRDYLYFLRSNDADTVPAMYRSFIETSCDAALNAVVKLLDETGWK